MNTHLYLTGTFTEVRHTVKALREQGIPFMIPRNRIWSETCISSRSIVKSWCDSNWMTDRSAVTEAWFRDRDLDMIRLISTCRVEERP